MLTVNIHDYNFIQSTCSVPFTSPKNVEYVRGQMAWEGITLFTDAYINNPIVDQVTSKYKIGWLREPFCLHAIDYYASLDNAHKFDAILTYHADFLLHAGYRFMPYAGTWLLPEHWGVKPKSKLVSMLFGGKRTSEGHQLRHEISERLGDKYGIDYYGFRGYPTDYSEHTKRRVLEDYYFSIVIETCREPNLFTEILLDCFAVGTIPIFWGAPNIDIYFDDTAILPFRDVVSLVSVLRELSPELYREMLPGVRANLELMKPYAVPEDWMFENVLKEFA